MSDVTQVLDSASKVLKFLYERNEELIREGRNLPTVTQAISDIEASVIKDPRSLLYHIADHNIYIVQILDILEKYPLALVCMRSYYDNKGDSAFYIMRRRGYTKALEKCFPGMPL